MPPCLADRSSCTKVTPPSSLIACSPRVPSVPVPDSTTPIARFCRSRARESKKLSIGRWRVVSARGVSRRTSPLSAMLAFGGSRRRGRGGSASGRSPPPRACSSPWTRSRAAGSRAQDPGAGRARRPARSRRRGGAGTPNRPLQAAGRGADADDRDTLLGTLGRRRRSQDPGAPTRGGARPARGASGPSRSSESPSRVLIARPQWLGPAARGQAASRSTRSSWARKGSGQRIVSLVGAIVLTYAQST